jgi:hypothetical protein
LLNKKASTPSERKYHIVFTTSIFVDVGDSLIMADDVATPSNPPIALVDKKEFEEAPLDKVTLKVNVSQRSCEKKPSRRMVRI